MKFNYTILYVDDVRRSLSFYEAAFGFRTKFLHEGGDWGELDTGTTVLAFSSRALLTQMGHKPSHPNSATPCFEIALSTDNVPAAVEHALQAGAKLVKPIEQTSWGQTVAYVSDFDDFLIGICTPITA